MCISIGINFHYSFLCSHLCAGLCLCFCHVSCSEVVLFIFNNPPTSRDELILHLHPVSAINSKFQCICLASSALTTFRTDVIASIAKQQLFLRCLLLSGNC